MTEQHWVIDVCEQCGRIAHWPFCDHLRVERNWTIPVIVQPSYPEDYWREIAKGRQRAEQRD